MDIFIDCTYTRLQDSNVGITRVVRSLLRELQADPRHFDKVTPVCFGRKEFRIAPHCSPVAGETSVKEAEKQSVGPLVALFRRLTSGQTRAYIVNSLPLLVQRILWRTYSSITFAHLSRQLSVAGIKAGDVVFLPDASWNYRVWECARAARARGAHIVTMIHDLIPLNHSEFVAPLFSEVFRIWFMRMLDCSTAVICNSQATLDEVVAYCKRQGLQHPPIGFFHLGSDFATPRSPRDSVRPEIDLIAASRHRGQSLFLTVGSIERRKRHDFLLDSFDLVWQLHPDTILVIVGRPGGEVEETLQRITKHPLRGKNLFWYVDASDEELSRLYSSTSALVFCSAAEGFGLPLVEARVLGCRVIASDIPAFRELADDGVELFAAKDGCALTLAIRDVIEGGNHRSSPLSRPPLQWSESANALVEQITRLLPLGSPLT